MNGFFKHFVVILKVSSPWMIIACHMLKHIWSPKNEKEIQVGDRTEWHPQMPWFVSTLHAH